MIERLPKSSSFAALLVIIEYLRLLVPKLDPTSATLYWPKGYVQDRAAVQQLLLKWIQKLDPTDARNADLLQKYKRKKAEVHERLQKVPKNQHQQDLWDECDPRKDVERYFCTEEERVTAEKKGESLELSRFADVKFTVDPGLTLPVLD